jgi:fused signal recognition particle receptor
MFGFLRRKKKPVDVEPSASPTAEAPLGQAAQEPAEAPPAAVPEAALAPAPATAPAPEPAPAPETAPERAPPEAPRPEAAASAPDAAPAAASAPAPASTELVATTAASDRRGWMSRLRNGLSRTRDNLAGIFSTTRLDDALYEELETALLTSDAGYEATTAVLEELRTVVRKQRLASGEQAREALRRILADLLRPLERPMDIDRAEPLVMMIAGVNGAGKTTSIGKLAHHLQREGKSILLAAGDTFRAAAREQLAEWGKRNDVQVIAQQGGDPGAVAFDAVTAGRARKIGVVMVDTAGRLPTQAHLMQELRKIHRVIAKAMPDAPHECLLVLDGNTGQNMLAQVKAFDEAVPLTGLIVTKLDGTAKGGALVALAHQRRDAPIPVYFIGVGEGIDDLQAFSADEFAQALLG